MLRPRLWLIKIMACLFQYPLICSSNIAHSSELLNQALRHVCHCLDIDLWSKIVTPKTDRVAVMLNEIRVALSDIVLTFVPQHNSHNQCDKSSAGYRKRKRWCLVSLVVLIVVVSPIEQIGYVYRKLRAKFALRKSTTIQPAFAPPLKHSHALDMLNG